MQPLLACRHTRSDITTHNKRDPVEMHSPSCKASATYALFLNIGAAAETWLLQFVPPGGMATPTPCQGRPHAINAQAQGQCPRTALALLLSAWHVLKARSLTRSTASVVSMTASRSACLNPAWHSSCNSLHLLRLLTPKSQACRHRLP